MFGLRLITEVQARSKNGQPAQNMTGVARRSPSQLSHARFAIATRPPVAISAIEAAKTGRDSTSAIQKRRLISRSSVFGPESSVIRRGSSAMPQIGQGPGSFARTSGSMGQTYSTTPLGGGASG